MSSNMVRVQRAKRNKEKRIFLYECTVAAQVWRKYIKKRCRMKIIATQHCGRGRVIAREEIKQNSRQKEYCIIRQRGVDVNREICKIYGTAERVGGRINKRRSIMRKKISYIYLYVCVHTRLSVCYKARKSFWVANIFNKKKTQKIWNDDDDSSE